MTNDRPRLRNAQLAPLRLERFWLEELHVKPIDADSESSVKLAPPLVLQDADDVRRYKVRLRARMTGNGIAVDAEVIGQFLLPDETSAEVSSQLIRFNCPSILFGVLRGIVSQVTAMTAAGRLDLPSVNLAVLAEP